jgi:glutamine cyclotransferase
MGVIVKLFFNQLIVCLSLLLSANLLGMPDARASATIYHYQVIAERAHDGSFFTQGLELHNHQFYESSGLYNQSFITRYPVAVDDQAAPSEALTQRLAPQYFAEGLTLFNNKLFVLTWREQTLLVYEPDTFKLLHTHRYSGQGWGLTNNGKQLIRSDGSHRLYFHSPENFALHKTVEVYYRQQAVERLNELEFVKGKVWANIWHDNRLVEIDPGSGQVTGLVDLTELVRSIPSTSSEQVLNGIAYDAEQDAFWVTGKLWPNLFLIKLTAHE